MPQPDHDDPVAGAAHDGIERPPVEQEPVAGHGRAAEIDQAGLPRRLTLNSLAVFDWTMISVLPFRVASMPFTLNPDW